MWFRRPRRTMVNGRLVAQESKGSGHFSWLRLLVLTSALIYLAASNPANDFSGIRQQTSTVLGFDLPLLSWWDDMMIKQGFSKWSGAAFTGRRNRQNRGYVWGESATSSTTNFGLFCVQEQRQAQVVVHIAGMEWNCRYNDPSLAIGGFSLCRHVLGDHMTHQRPVFYDDSDYVFTTHRILSWLLLAAALMAFCYTAPVMIETGNVWLDSFVCFFVDTNREVSPTGWPLWSVGTKLLQLNVLVYPALLVMQTTIQQQHRNSFFAMFESDVSNYGLSLVVLAAMALVASVASKSWSTSPSGFLPQFDAVVAVAMGFYADYQAVGMGTRGSSSSSNSNTGLGDDGAIWNVLSWTMFVLIVTRGSITAAVFWYATRCTGQMLFVYQFEHMVSVSAFRTLYSMVDSASLAVEQLVTSLVQPFRY